MLWHLCAVCMFPFCKFSCCQRPKRHAVCTQSGQGRLWDDVYWGYAWEAAYSFAHQANSIWLSFCSQYDAQNGMKNASKIPQQGLHSRLKCDDTSTLLCWKSTHHLTLLKVASVGFLNRDGFSVYTRFHLVTFSNALLSVSYTHLTLPTIYSV